MSFWISWEQPATDASPSTYPPNEHIIGCWSTGWTDAEALILCALVDADTIADAQAAVVEEWPDVDRWRFCEDGTEWKETERFRFTDHWSRERFYRPA